jgi:hypothetical protein
VNEWVLAPRAGVNKKGKQNTQIEYTEMIHPVKEGVEAFIKPLEVNRPHYSEANWLNRTRRIDSLNIPKNKILIMTDFLATLDVRGAQTGNSSTDAHAVLAIYVVLDSQREVKVTKNGKEVRTKVNECNVCFFGDTISKGKKNDLVFHNTCLDEIIGHYQRQFKRVDNPPITSVII